RYGRANLAPCERRTGATKSSCKRLRQPLSQVFVDGRCHRNAASAWGRSTWSATRTRAKLHNAQARLGTDGAGCCQAGRATRVPGRWPGRRGRRDTVQPPGDRRGQDHLAVGVALPCTRSTRWPQEWPSWSAVARLQASIVYREVINTATPPP